MLLGDGFEIETMINCRMAAADVEITEVGSVELSRTYLHPRTDLIEPAGPANATLAGKTA
jgi:hypothetical protein